MSKVIRVVVVDDHPLFRGGVVHILAARPEIEVVAEGASADEALRLVKETQPDVVLLDLHMPGGGLTALNALASQHPDTKCVMLTVAVDAENVRTAMGMGASAYLIKGVGGDELVETVLAVYSGERYVSPTLAAQLLSGLEPSQVGQVDRRTTLTYRERQILAFVTRGLSNKEIGSKLSVSDKTVKHHLSGVLRKLKVRNRVEAAMFGRQGNQDLPIRRSDLDQALAKDNRKTFET